MKSELNECREYSSTEIAEAVSRYRSGSLPLAKFARQEGIPHGRLHYWLYGKPGGQSGRSSGRPPARLAFEEIRLTSPLGGAPEWAAEVSLCGGVSVRFKGSAAPKWIGLVVQALQRPC